MKIRRLARTLILHSLLLQNRKRKQKISSWKNIIQKRFSGRFSQWELNSLDLKLYAVYFWNKMQNSTWEHEKKFPVSVFAVTLGTTFRNLFLKSPKTIRHWLKVIIKTVLIKVFPLVLLLRPSTILHLGLPEKQHSVWEKVWQQLCSSEWPQ